MKSCIIFGGSGFIGSNLVDKLIKLGHRVSIVDDLSTGSVNNIPKNCAFYKLNLEDFFKRESNIDLPV